MKWILIDDKSEHNIKTYAFMIEKIGCMVLVETTHGTSLTFADGTQIVDNQLVPMEGYGYTPEDEADYDQDNIED